MPKLLSRLVVALALLSGCVVAASAAPPMSCKAFDPHSNTHALCKTSCDESYKKDPKMRTGCNKVCDDSYEYCKKKVEEVDRQVARCHDAVIACMTDCKKKKQKDDQCQKTCGSGDTKRSYDACVSKAKAQL